MRTVLILSPHFPPSTVAGVHRARHLAKWLPSHGWRPVIVRADPSLYTEPGDPALASLVPDSVLQVRTSALPAALTRRAGIGDIGIRAYSHFSRALEEAAREHGADLVLITGSPFYPMLLARRLRARLGLPVVLDFQDPWVSAEGALRPRLSKGGAAHQLSLWLEPRAVRHADFVTSVSETQNRQMAQRYPWLDASRMASIPIGGDPEDFDALRARPPADAIHRLDSAKVNLSYVGTFLPRAGPLVQAVFRAARRLAEHRPDLAARLRLNFVGTSNQPGATGDGPVMPLARAEGVAHLLAETPRRVPFLEALAILANSQGLLMIGSDEPHYTASKIYPGLMSARPYLSLFHAESSAHAILSAAGGGRSLALRSLEDLPGLEAPMAEALAALCEQPESFGKADPAAYAPYTAQAVAGDFARVFDGVVARHALQQAGQARRGTT